MPERFEPEAWNLDAQQRQRARFGHPWQDRPRAWDAWGGSRPPPRSLLPWIVLTCLGACILPLLWLATRLVW